LWIFCCVWNIGLQKHFRQQLLQGRRAVLFHHTTLPMQMQVVVPLLVPLICFWA
jgi:hypothetical protein